MRSAINPKVERFRIRTGALASNSTLGNNGAFAIPHPNGTLFSCIVSDSANWDHVSCKIIERDGSVRTPSWDEMCYLKDLFFEEEEVVMQLHPAKSKHLNLHPYVLHLWRPQKAKIPLPPPQMVAPTNNTE